MALYFARLGSDPPGVYDDEASIGYNAWTIAHYGVDQYGNHLPLFFVAFGDYKGPVPVYLAAPLMWFWAGSNAALRAPSVIAGLAIVLVAGLLAWRLTHARWIALLAGLFTALQPWVFLESHTMMGNVLLMLSVMLMVWCVVEAMARERAKRWWTAAGIALAAGVFTYSIGELLVALLAVTVVLTCRRSGREQLLRFVFPIAAAYAVLIAVAVVNPQAVFARAQVAGLLSDHPSMLTTAGRFLANYASYFSPNFLAIGGDGNYRQTTGFGGVLLVATLPLMVAGAIRLYGHRHEAYARFVLLGVLVTPVPAALALVAPHALRGGGLFPFLIILIIEGLAWVRGFVQWRPLLAAGLAVAAVATAAPYFADFFTAYPARASLAFDAGEAHAIAVAYGMASRTDHRLFLSMSLNQPAMQLMYAISAPPPQDAFIRRARIDVVGTRSALAGARAGDVLVLAPDDWHPPSAHLVFALRQGQMKWDTTSRPTEDLLRVYLA